MLNNIVCATDFSDASEKAVEWSRYLAGKTGAKVTLLHVVQTSGFAMAGTGTGGEAQRNAERDQLDALAMAFHAECATALLEGDPAWAVANYTKEHPVDLLVLGSHAYTGLTRWLHGSVSDDTLHAVDCPVLRC